MTTDDAAGAVLLVPPASDPRGAATYRALGAKFEGGVLTVKVVGGADVKIPAEGTTFIVNGVTGSEGVKSYNPARVPAWFAEHAGECAKADKENVARVDAGKRLKLIPPIHLTLADTDEGTVARFDQR